MGWDSNFNWLVNTQALSDHAILKRRIFTGLLLSKMKTDQVKLSTEKNDDLQDIPMTYSHTLPYIYNNLHTPLLQEIDQFRR